MTYIWVNIGSSNGLLPDGTKPLPEPMLTYHQWSFVVFTLQQFTASAWHEISVHGMSLKIIILKLRPHPPGANELKSNLAAGSPLCSQGTPGHYLGQWLGHHGHWRVNHKLWMVTGDRDPMQNNIILLTKNSCCICIAIPMINCCLYVRCKVLSLKYSWLTYVCYHLLCPINNLWWLISELVLIYCQVGS